MELSPLEKQLKTLEGLLVEGLLTDGEHHKQWYMEEALKIVRAIEGRPFPDDLGKLMLNLGSLEEGVYDDRWVSLAAHHAYRAGIAP